MCCVRDDECVEGRKVECCVNRQKGAGGCTDPGNSGWNSDFYPRDCLPHTPHPVATISYLNMIKIIQPPFRPTWQMMNIQTTSNYLSTGLRSIGAKCEYSGWENPHSRWVRIWLVERRVWTDWYRLFRRRPGRRNVSSQGDTARAYTICTSVESRERAWFQACECPAFVRYFILILANLSDWCRLDQKAANSLVKWFSRWYHCH